MLTINALVAADSVLIPLQVAYLPAKGLEQLLLTINKVRRQLNRKLMIEGILFSMVDMRTNFSRDYVALIEEAYGSNIRIFNARIPFSVRAAEASAAGVSIFMHDAKGKVAASYKELTREVLANGD
jgi:chromosome partitioning protein